ncbi:MAG TPA: HAMP domain-containing sensor histidine kinase [Fontimonas sp.]
MSGSAATKPHRWSLRRRIVAGLVVYVVLLTAGVLANDFYVNERAEALVWESLLHGEMNHFLERRAADPQHRWTPTAAHELYELRPGESTHPELRALPPGVHDEILIGGRERVVLIEPGTAGERYALSLDITELERGEAAIRGAVFIAAFVSALLLAILAAWGVSRLTRPLKTVADQIRALSPGKSGQRVLIPEHSSAEVAVIAEAMNAYSVQIEQFIEREREFISTASHELRTPLSIIDGAVSLALDDSGLTAPAQARLERIRQTVADVNELMAMLLVLAKNPDRLADASEVVSLNQIVMDCVHELKPLADGKGLSVAARISISSHVLGPAPMIKSAIGNLIRNAIEHSHQGQVAVYLDTPGIVRIVNPGGSIDAEELSRIYTRLARGDGRDGGGIGLALISKLCTHCGWDLSFAETENHGIRMSIRFPQSGPSS